MARVIQSPGVEINEIDLSTRTTFPAGTNILITGFSQNGPTDEVLSVTTFQEYETIYGAPTNAAERYFYHTVKSVFNSPANIMTARLPYGKNAETHLVMSFTAHYYFQYLEMEIRLEKNRESPDHRSVLTLTRTPAVIQPLSDYPLVITFNLAHQYVLTFYPKSTSHLVMVKLRLVTIA